MTHPRSLSNKGFPKIIPTQLNPTFCCWSTSWKSWKLVCELLSWAVKSSFFWGFLVLTATPQPPEKKSIQKSTSKLHEPIFSNCPTWKKNSHLSGEKTPHQWRQGAQSCNWAPSVRFDTTLSASAIPTHGRLPGEVNWLIWQVSKVSNRVT